MAQIKNITSVQSSQLPSNSLLIKGLATIFAKAALRRAQEVTNDAGQGG
jgi:hypothetical protein